MMMASQYPVKSKVMSKTYSAETTEEIDKISNEFRKNNDCIATTVNTCSTPQGRIIITQTIFYTERRD
jgi:hypothetical protein